jgi:hypothetical protein
VAVVLVGILILAAAGATIGVLHGNRPARGKPVITLSVGAVTTASKWNGKALVEAASVVSGTSVIFKACQFVPGSNWSMWVKQDYILSPGHPQITEIASQPVPKGHACESFSITVSQVGRPRYFALLGVTGVYATLAFTPQVLSMVVRAAPRQGPVSVGIAHNISNLARAAIQRTMQMYFTAINEKQFDRALALFSPDGRVAVASSITKGDATTQDSNILIRSIVGRSNGSEAALVTFTSHQAPMDSPTRAAPCLDWTITYLFSSGGSTQWQIDAAQVVSYAAC